MCMWMCTTPRSSDRITTSPNYWLLCSRLCMCVCGASTEQQNSENILIENSIKCCKLKSLWCVDICCTSKWISTSAPLSMLLMLCIHISFGRRSLYTSLSISCTNFCTNCNYIMNFYSVRVCEWNDAGVDENLLNFIWMISRTTMENVATEIRQIPMIASNAKSTRWRTGRTGDGETFSQLLNRWQFTFISSQTVFLSLSLHTNALCPCLAVRVLRVKRFFFFWCHVGSINIARMNLLPNAAESIKQGTSTRTHSH